MLFPGEFPAAVELPTPPPTECAQAHLGVYKRTFAPVPARCSSTAPGIEQILAVFVAIARSRFAAGRGRSWFSPGTTRAKTRSLLRLRPLRFSSSKTPGDLFRKEGPVSRATGIRRKHEISYMCIRAVLPLRALIMRTRAQTQRHRYRNFSHPFASPRFKVL